MVRSFGIFRHAAAVILNPELHLIILAADGDRDGRRLGMLEHVAQGFTGNLQQMDRLVRGNKTRWQLVIQFHREAQPGTKLLTAGLQRRAQPRLGELQTEGGQQLAKLNPRGVKLVADLAEQLFAALGHAFVLHLQAAHLHLHAGEGLGHFKRAETVDGVNDTRALEEVGLTEAQAQEMYRYLAIANYEDRFVVPSSHRELAREAFPEKSGCGFTFGDGCHGSDSKFNLFNSRRIDAMDVTSKTEPHQ